MLSFKGKAYASVATKPATMDDNTRKRELANEH